MAPKAFILIETAVGKAKEVATSLGQINGLKSVDMVTGPYDIITTIEAETLNNIGDMVTGKIHALMVSPERLPAW